MALKRPERPLFKKQKEPQNTANETEGRGKTQTEIKRGKKIIGTWWYEKGNGSVCVTAGAWAGYSFYRTFPAFTRLDLVLPSILLFLSLPNLIAIDSFTFHPIFFSIELSVVQFDRPFAQFYWLFFYELGKTFTEILTSRVLLISIGSYLILPVFAALRGRRTDKLDVVEKPKFLCFFLPSVGFFTRFTQFQPPLPTFTTDRMRRKDKTGKKNESGRDQRRVNVRGSKKKQTLERPGILACFFSYFR